MNKKYEHGYVARPLLTSPNPQKKEMLNHVPLSCKSHHTSDSLPPHSTLNILFPLHLFLQQPVKFISTRCHKEKTRRIGSPGRHSLILPSHLSPKQHSYFLWGHFLDSCSLGRVSDSDPISGPFLTPNHLGISALILLHAVLIFF